MARKRQLDPQFFTDEEIAAFSFEGRLFYAGTWCNCEDTGVFEVKHLTLKAQIFPHDVIDTQPLYNQIRDAGKYIEYQAGEKTYAFIKGFHNRQIIQWPSRSHLPLPPPPYLELIPEKIRKLNDSSMSPHSVLTEHSQRIELNRIEKNRIEKAQPYWAAFSEKTQEELKVVSKEFNIYQLLGKLKKDKGVEIPEEVVNKICASYVKNKPGIKKAWPWFIVTTQKEWEFWNAEQSLREGQAWKDMPVSPVIKQILAGMKLGVDK
jgi:hypothetical protein